MEPRWRNNVASTEADGNVESAISSGVRKNIGPLHLSLSRKQGRRGRESGVVGARDDSMSCRSKDDGNRIITVPSQHNKRKTSLRSWRPSRCMAVKEERTKRRQLRSGTLVTTDWKISFTACSMRPAPLSSSLLSLFCRLTIVMFPLISLLGDSNIVHAGFLPTPTCPLAKQTFLKHFTYNHFVRLCGKQDAPAYSAQTPMAAASLRRNHLAHTSTIMSVSSSSPSSSTSPSMENTSKKTSPKPTSLDPTERFNADIARVLSRSSAPHRGLPQPPPSPQHDDDAKDVNTNSHNNNNERKNDLLLRNDPDGAERAEAMLHHMIRLYRTGHRTARPNRDTFLLVMRAYAQRRMKRWFDRDWTSSSSSSDLYHGDDSDNENDKENDIEPQ